MLKIGITGGIGSGKTTVCRIFEVLGVPVFYADNAAKSIMIDDGLLKEAIIMAFGNASYFQSGELNRKYISSIVFNDQQQLAKLNALVHPAVFRAFDTWVTRQVSAPYVLKEAALLFESGSYKMCDKSILVTSPEALKLARIMNRDGVTAEEVKLRMQKQYSDEHKEKLSDHMIINDEIVLLIPQVLDLHRYFLTLRNDH